MKKEKIKANNSSKPTKAKKINKKNNKKNIMINKDNYLYYIFFILLIIVIFLGIKVYIESTKPRPKQANIVIPILEKNSIKELNINLKELAKEKTYSIKISNYRQNLINEENIDYKITIINDSKSKIKVTKDEDDTNLIKNQEATRIEGVSLKSKKKDYSIYYFSIKEKNNIKKNDKINIKIES